MVDVWDDEDFFEDECAMKTADFQKMSTKLGNDGYRIGKGQEEEKQMQLGFNKGFSQGIVLGRLCGALLGTVRSKLAEIEKIDGVSVQKQQLVSHLTSILFEDIPESKRDIQIILDDIFSVISVISTDLQVTYENFKTNFVLVIQQ
jgi:hypothetical protein